MCIAFVGHTPILPTIFAPNFGVLYLPRSSIALNGTVEAVINPVVATIYKDK